MIARGNLVQVECKHNSLGSTYFISERVPKFSEFPSRSMPLENNRVSSFTFDREITNGTCFFLVSTVCFSNC